MAAMTFSSISGNDDGLPEWEDDFSRMNDDGWEGMKKRRCLDIMFLYDY